MPLLERFKDSVTRVFPRKNELDPPVDTAHLGYGNSLGPFDDDMILSKPAIVFHSLQAFFSFLAMACFASVASFQASHKIGPSGLSGFAIFITIVSLILSLFLLAIPVIYDKYNKFNRLARAMKEDRVQFILIGTGAITTLLISFIVTISAWTEPGCKNPDDDPNAKLGDDFKNGLSGWCSTKKAGAVFMWIAFAAWSASIVLAFMDWRSGKTKRRAGGGRDPPFTHPNDPSGYAPSLQARRDDYDEEEGDIDEEEEPFSYPGGRRYGAGGGGGGGGAAPQLPPYRANTGGLISGQSPFSDEYRAPGGGVGGFTQPPPAAAVPPPTSSNSNANTSSGPGVSRTMQYADPYAAIKANLASSAGTGGQGQGGNDYSYTGYR